MDINREIRRLINYGLDKDLIEKQDEVMVINQILEILQLESFIDCSVENEVLAHPQEILDNILDFAFNTGVLKSNATSYRDLLDTRIMGCFIAKPSQIVKEFYKNYHISPKLATDQYYAMAFSSNYIRKSRIEKDIRWKTLTKYGELDLTINLSKPEKDPRDIIAAKTIKKSGYPKCLLCKENEGFSGNLTMPARQNLRLIPVDLEHEAWFMQYSPYVYYNEHLIVINGEHTPMKIDIHTFTKLLAFVEKFPHYFVGSNADLPIVGGSILSHDHFQGGRYTFPMARAPIQKRIVVNGYEDVDAGIVKWPMSVIRLRSLDKERLVDASTHILNIWRPYQNQMLDIIPYTGQEPHNTITPIARYRDNQFEIDLVLRNNRTNKKHPLGIFHPHSEWHHIKKENIGLIEVMGMAILPPRLKDELETIKKCLLKIEDFDQHEEIVHHKSWFYNLKEKYSGLSVDFEEIPKEEVGLIYENILKDAGVFKQDEAGQAAFIEFLS
ncbi:MAG: UDP-glucose--hexose-1-phosphate uridylyltransferase [Tissierellales bacterium]|nr:UDP-glucose--hexose-1-phosphate uridylyltransferase [Tissierellales bacterium]